MKSPFGFKLASCPRVKATCDRMPNASIYPSALDGAKKLQKHLSNRFRILFGRIMPDAV